MGIQKENNGLIGLYGSLIPSKKQIFIFILGRLRTMFSGTSLDL
jgi:hypothetical protein